MLWPNTMGVQFGMTLYGIGEWHHPDTSRMYVNLQTSPNTDQFEIWWEEPFVILSSAQSKLKTLKLLYLYFLL
jgi:hypothetical protein